MNPEEVTKLVEEILSKSLTFPWWSYVIALIVPFIGGFLGAYSKKKGEGLATKEDFDYLLDQVKKTTVATEGI